MSFRTPAQNASTAEVNALLPELFQAEDAAQRHCALVARRLEMGRCSVSLLEVACHADAALEDLPELAERRHITLSRVGFKFMRLAASLRTFALDVVLDTFDTYRETLAEIRRGVNLARRLERAAARDGDEILASWCILFVAQRTPMLERIARELGEAHAA